MKKLQFSTIINAPKEKVWHTMLDDAPYRDWTSAFSPGSYYRGDWSEGSKILFLGPDPQTGSEGGMVSRIAQNRPYEFIPYFCLVQPPAGTYTEQGGEISERLQTITTASAAEGGGGLHHDGNFALRPNFSNSDHPCFSNHRSSLNHDLRYSIVRQPGITIATMIVGTVTEMIDEVRMSERSREWR